MSHPASEKSTAELAAELEEVRAQFAELKRSVATDITEHERVVKALRESEVRYSLTLEAVDDGLWDWHIPDGAAVFSARYYAILGFDDGGFVASYDSWRQLVHPEDVDRVEADLRRSIEENRGFLIDLRMNTKSGAWRWVSTRGKAVERAADGSALRMVGTLSDITERKRAEKELRASELKYRSLIESASDAIFCVDEKGEYQFANRVFATTLGRSPEDFIGKTFWDIYPKEHADFRYDATHRVFVTGRSESLEVEVPLPGKLLYYYATINPIHDETGKVIMVLTHSKDITARKHAEWALAAEKERLAVTLRSIGDGVITTDTQGNVVIMNRVAEQLTGWLQSEAKGKPLATVFRIINEGTRLPCENPAEKVLATGGVIELANHTLLISSDGTERIISDSGAPIMDQNSVTIGVVLVFRDMTEKQKLLDVLQRTDRLEALGILAGGIAHDFNNLLAGIFGYVEIARAITTDNEVSEYLEQAMSVFGRAKGLTQQLLTFSKGGTPRLKTSELGPLLRESALFALSGSKIACDFFIDGDLWLADFDKNQLGQVIDNLVINAQQAMPMGGKLVITAKNAVLKEGDHPLLKAGKFIKLSIADAGIGIPPDLLKHIFDPFFTTKQKGHGLGLTTCYAIVQKHQGSIEAESMIGVGSTFHVFLPASQQGSVQAASHSSVLHKGRGRILIMDDEPFIREILGRSLKAMGYSVLEAKDGVEALRICAEAMNRGTPIDGAFFDLTIPGGMGGKETILQLRKTYPNLPVYASSGYSEDPVMAKPTEYGFTDSIGKPYRIDDLAALLNRNTPKNS